MPEDIRSSRTIETTENSTTRTERSPNRIDHASGDGLIKRGDSTCHNYTFYNGTSDKKIPRRHIEKDFHLLGSRSEYQSNPSLYEDLADRLTAEEGKYKDHYIATYRAEHNNDPDYPIHSSPIAYVYQKQDGTHSIMLEGKQGKRPVKLHDIEDVPNIYKDKDELRWEIRFTRRKNGRRMDFTED